MKLKCENSKFQNYTWQFLAYIETAFLAEFLSDTKLFEVLPRLPTPFQGHTKQLQKVIPEWYFTQVCYIFAV